MNLRGTPYDNLLMAKGAYMVALIEGFGGTLEEFLDRERDEIAIDQAAFSVSNGLAELKRRQQFDLIKKLIAEVMQQ